MAPYTLLFAAQIFVVSWTAQGYNEAYQQSLESGKPLLVFVGADWCGACQVMKTRVMPELEQEGVFKDIHCAQLDLSKDAALAKRVSKTKTIPCLILFTKTDDKWQRRELTGMHNRKSVEAFLAKYTAEEGASRTTQKNPR